MLLQDNQVIAYISPGVVRESVVRQTQCRHKVGTFYQFHSDKGRSGIHHTLRCDKGDNTTLSHLVKAFEKEVIVQ